MTGFCPGVIAVLKSYRGLPSVSPLSFRSRVRHNQCMMAGQYSHLKKLLPDAREMGLMADQGWSSIHPAGQSPSRPKQMPVRLQRQNSGDGMQMSPGFGPVKTMILLRGLPGSGKSTLASQLAGITGIICSTDDFFVVNGSYIFDPSKLGENHQKNQDKACRAMEAGITPVIIDNTNTAATEMKPYVLMAQSFGYETRIMEPQTEWKFSVAELERRNSHGVACETLMKMLSRYEHNLTIQQIIQTPEPPQNNRRNMIQARSEQYRNGQHRHNRQYQYRNGPHAISSLLVGASKRPSV